MIMGRKALTYEYNAFLFILFIVGRPSESMPSQITACE